MSCSHMSSLRQCIVIEAELAIYVLLYDLSRLLTKLLRMDSANLAH